MTSKPILIILSNAVSKSVAAEPPGQGDQLTPTF